MSAPLEDLRAKITARAHCALVADSRALGLDKAEIVRDILDQWAAKKIHAARMLDRCLRAKGEPGALEGASGADEGIAGRADGNSLEWDGE